MAAVSVVDLQYAEIDFGRDIFDIDGITKLSWINSLKEKKKLNLKLVWKTRFLLFICIFVLNYDKKALLNLWLIGKFKKII